VTYRFDAREEQHHGERHGGEDEEAHRGVQSALVATEVPRDDVRGSIAHAQVVVTVATEVEVQRNAITAIEMSTATLTSTETAATTAWHASAQANVQCEENGGDPDDLREVRSKRMHDFRAGRRRRARRHRGCRRANGASGKRRSTSSDPRSVRPQTEIAMSTVTQRRRERKRRRQHEKKQKAGNR